jgi:hypothetical protein
VAKRNAAGNELLYHTRQCHLYSVFGLCVDEILNGIFDVAWSVKGDADASTTCMNCRGNQSSTSNTRLI